MSRLWECYNICWRIQLYKQCTYKFIVIKFLNTHRRIKSSVGNRLRTKGKGESEFNLVSFQWDPHKNLAFLFIFFYFHKRLKNIILHSSLYLYFTVVYMSKNNFIFYSRLHSKNVEKQIWHFYLKLVKSFKWKIVNFLKYI